MPPARYGRPPGFGGGYDTAHRGIFQPGTEVGVIDPNAGRFYSIASSWSLTAHSAQSVVSLTSSSTKSGVHHYPER